MKGSNFEQIIVISKVVTTKILVTRFTASLPLNMQSILSDACKQIFLLALEFIEKSSVIYQQVIMLYEKWWVVFLI